MRGHVLAMASWRPSGQGLASPEGAQDSSPWGRWCLEPGLSLGACVCPGAWPSRLSLCHCVFWYLLWRRAFPLPPRMAGLAPRQDWWFRHPRFGLALLHLTRGMAISPLSLVMAAAKPAASAVALGSFAPFSAACPPADLLSRQQPSPGSQGLLGCGAKCRALGCPAQGQGHGSRGSDPASKPSSAITSVGAWMR